MEYGKFASLDELVKGYNELEKSFTQKCQQLAETERKNDALTAQLAQNNLGTNEPSSPSEQVGTAHSTTVDSVEVVPQDAESGANSASFDPAPATTIPTDDQLQQYLLNNPEIAQKLLQNAQVEFAPNVMCGGGNVPLAPPSRPKTIKEASLMARDLFALK